MATIICTVVPTMNPFGPNNTGSPASYNKHSVQHIYKVLDKLSLFSPQLTIWVIESLG